MCGSCCGHLLQTSATMKSAGRAIQQREKATKGASGGYGWLPHPVDIEKLVYRSLGWKKSPKIIWSSPLLKESLEMHYQMSCQSQSCKFSVSKTPPLLWATFSWCLVVLLVISSSYMQMQVTLEQPVSILSPCYHVVKRLSSLWLSFRCWNID